MKTPKLEKMQNDFIFELSEIFRQEGLISTISRHFQNINMYEEREDLKKRTESNLLKCLEISRSNYGVFGHKGDYHIDLNSNSIRELRGRGKIPISNFFQELCREDLDIHKVYNYPNEMEKIINYIDNNMDNVHGAFNPTRTYSKESGHKNGLFVVYILRNRYDGVGFYIAEGTDEESVVRDVLHSHEDPMYLSSAKKMCEKTINLEEIDDFIRFSEDINAVVSKASQDIRKKKETLFELNNIILEELGDEIVAGRI